MSTKVGINGFGRIGRNVFRVAMNNPEVEIGQHRSIGTFTAVRFRAWRNRCEN